MPPSFLVTIDSPQSYQEWLKTVLKQMPLLSRAPAKTNKPDRHASRASWRSPQ
ncbi:MAG: hypothetical protein KME17_20480 [Cyanosarcina radialis HA8281-LM2]|nr:hypothetical protein [Cyanosarcina radialis HA8281-LM2]